MRPQPARTFAPLDASVATAPSMPAAEATRPSPAGTVERAAAAALDRAVAHLRRPPGHQPAGGRASSRPTSRWTPRTCCCGSSSASATAQETAEAARWIRSQQRADGTWATFYGGPADLSTTVEAWVALRLAGDDPRRAAHARRRPSSSAPTAASKRTRVFTRIWLALFGLWSWDDLPEMPPEMILLPSWFPLNIYDWGCWARQTVVPLTIVCSLRAGAPGRFGIDELHAGPRPAPTGRRCGRWPGVVRPARHASCTSTRGARSRRLRAAASRRAADWILARQEADGVWGGIQPPWVYSLLALHLLRLPARPSGDPGRPRRAGRLHRPRADAGRLRTPAGGLPVAGMGHRAGADRAARRRRRAGRPGGAAAPPTGCSTRRSRSPATGRCAGRSWRPGGWAFEFANDGYPDTDDTAEIVLALAPVPRTPTRRALRAAVDRGVAWTVGMQSRDGGWGAFDADNTRDAGRPSCRSATSARSSTRRRPTSPRTSSRCSPPTGRPQTAACTRGVRWLLDAPGARRFAGSAAGAPTTSTAPAPPYRRWSRRASPAPARRSGAPCLARRRTRTRTAAGARTCAPTATRTWVGRGDVHRVADGLGAAGAAGRRRATRRRSDGAGHRLAGRTQRPDGAGTSRSSPAPASPATSTSTTTCTGWCSRSRRSAVTSGRPHEPGRRLHAAAGRVPRCARPAPSEHVTVTRTGQGPAGRWPARDRIGSASARLGGVLVAGVAGALRRHVQPGDVVVATEVRGPDGRRSPARPRRCSPPRCAGSGSRSTSARRVT